MNDERKRLENAITHALVEFCEERMTEAQVQHHVLSELNAILDELDTLKQRHPESTREFAAVVLSEAGQPHAPTVAAALREVGLCIAEPDFDVGTLFKRAVEIEEGREDG